MKPGSPARLIIAFGLVGGVVAAVLQLIEYRWLIVERSAEIYGVLVAAVFAGVGIWLGRKLTRRTTSVEVREVRVPAQPFVRDEAQVRALGLTPRELEVLELITEGLSTREIADRTNVSENTVKTHTKRVLEKLGARRRTEAIREAKRRRLIP